MHWIGPYSLKCIHVHVYIFWYSFQANIFYFGFLFGLENLRRQKPALYISLQTKYPLGNKCGNVAWNRFFFFYWKDCLGVYVSDIKRNQILLLSSTHLNIILRFDFKLRLCGSLVGMCFPASTAIYTLFCFLFLSGSELVWKIMKMSSMQDIWIKKM